MTNKPENPYEALLIPPLGIVQGVAPILPHDEDGPQVIFLNEAAKKVKFKMDMTAIRIVVHPSGRVDHEY